VTGILACPDMIAPSYWLAYVWGETGEAEFADPNTAEKTIGAVMEHYNSVAKALTQTFSIEPIYKLTQIATKSSGSPGWMGSPERWAYDLMPGQDFLIEQMKKPAPQ